MNRPLIALAGLIVAGGTAGGVLIVTSSGGEEELVREIETATPAASASPISTDTPPSSATPAAAPAPSKDLPPAETGYKWFVAPASGFGLPTYDVQIPADWESIYPGDSNPRWFSRPADNAGAFDPHLVIKVTPPGPWTGEVFKFELGWQSGGLCGVLGDGQSQSAAGSWSLYRFTCPKEETGYCSPSADGTAITCTTNQKTPLQTVDGRAAELRIGDHFFSVIVFDPEGADADAAFDKAVSTLVPRWP